ncbi:mannitol dehydrogenase family protein [Candidatus Epulonipiscium viviparus]|uniref:mannitol dehydrogenase family protein n=1 Tax=Candidatus Epulonipiscium viviparus TaxID=420336 RepID=UPI0027380E94|nr:mannitol dehydrogenase family protein [Candidatus Epulopiscium viviparus]
MKLKLATSKVLWEQVGVKTPRYDIKKMAENTVASPKWVHFGAGNIFRGYIAAIANDLLNKGLVHTGIIAVETFDFDIIDKIYEPYDNLALLVRLNPTGVLEKEIIASIATGIKGNAAYADYAILKKAFKNPSLQMASFTITEKGYALADAHGVYFGEVATDITNGPAKCNHAISVVCSLLLDRFNTNAAPIALVSMDNCAGNGDKLKSAVLTIANEWYKHNFVPKEFIQYLEDESVVAFPISMIDKITPRPAAEVEAELNKIGIENIQAITTSKGTFIAPFVNAEVAEYLVIEDKFPNGKPPLEKAGVYITDKATVAKVETMKVTTCLNPLHTALAVYGVVLGYNRIYMEMQDEQLKTLVKKIGEEGMKVVVNPEIIEPKQFLAEVFERLSNPFIPDDPARIATDTSQKVGIRFGETIKAYVKVDQAQELTFIPLAIAGWLRYLIAVDDDGAEISLSSDPMLDELRASLAAVKLGKEYKGEAAKILANEKIFGIDLTKIGLAAKIESMFVEMIAGEGAVRATLKKYCI